MATIYVNSDYGDDIRHNGTLPKPYQTINRAFADIPISVSSDYTIMLLTPASPFAAVNVSNYSDAGGSILITASGTPARIQTMRFSNWSAKVKLDKLVIIR